MPEQADTRSRSLDRERTALANERTFLAYIRTSISLLVLGAVLIHFSQDPNVVLFGVFASGVGITALVFGTWRFLKVRIKIERY
jgi:putative membrane protein